MELDFIDISRTEEERKKSVQSRPDTKRKKAVSRETEARNSQERQNQKAAFYRSSVRNQKEIEKRRKRRKKARIVRTVKLAALFGLVLLLIFILVWLVFLVAKGGGITDVFNSQRRELIKANDTEKPQIAEDFLTVNPYSRPGEKLGKVKNIFVHYTANQGTSAAQNRSYFENLGITGETSASAHFVIGYDGEIIQWVPLDEIAYAVKKRNGDSISIECCYLREDGRFTEATYQSLLQLTAWLLKEYKLTPEDVMRHYDEGGKKCPLYYVENEGEWQQFLADLSAYILKDNAWGEMPAA